MGLPTQPYQRPCKPRDQNSRRPERIASKRQHVKLSKFLALILRHQPERFGLKLDEEGWTSLSDVMEVLHALPNFRWAKRSDVIHIVRQGTGDGKNRFELDDNRIRALYGHSFHRRIEYEPIEPPPRLYHGTSPEAVEAINREGLKPMGRQYVHLSPDRKTAVQVGTRHASHPVVLTVHAREAHAAGVAFYHPEQGVYLAEPIPPSFLETDT